jgi:hypothetical protein
MVWIALEAAAAGPWLHDAKDFMAQQGHTNLLRKNSKNCTLSFWNGVAARKIRAPGRREVSHAHQRCAMKSVSVGRNRVNVA